ncbi:ectoine hydroxylase-related dioxygenase (phytanoyl-CoA dioxygenase family) [Streptomyces sp. SAI-208]|uniref:phytanoyl-CoA dioxygenase family protein n=1 Tax=unclassified Streptomyces TaxID=2593676 RepID=UPI002474BEBD|nr:MULTISPECIES: phytanoyl-CoA dioxygenase family protein [unclassified Streptomyces]MDH6515058.1 ectoine hydroxylase-related dioxygenase (phytanoyl-CoA dioxygenase family) [Streptomyces sp. SAI-090]MDH6547272.1 ectoine hydroxylase-related dioxygenase (phytanoyl-CoA dioxygenase family) [Streptomyces sp. SAI-041]MDH6566353.1 ectoine hydroxylase-related dioxygenase (phytanoyl-CoA dioxygenase family) [Streptomyces sp. SAI-117]MDH6588708.1 ectoine hydroxylase-related dioxygenase (phytanoyl-CoA diox
MSFTAVHRRAWLSEQDCDLEAFRVLVERTADPADYPYASAVERNVLLYDTERVRGAKDRRDVQEELVRALADGPGVAVFRGAFPDPAVVDRFTEVFDSLIREQYAAGTTAGDHFAKPGANERVWNALEKAALYDPAAFADYYANPVLALVSEAWLGPGYQVTSQVNVVNPGGLAQTAHRDYHLGFLSDEAAAAYPAHVHRLSPVLTLQGAVAHCDMPVESGPTLYLPYSQLFEPGYLAWRRPEFQAYFKEHHVQLPLAKGDAVFFNPALFHAAGTNRTTDVRRMANLLQVSSAFGRAMETVDREAVSNAVYPALLRRKTDGADAEWLDNVIAASAEGYPFPTNLDSDPPVDGLAPPSQADLVRRALAEGWNARVLRDELRAGADRRTS